MRKLMTGALAAVALAGLSGGVVAANAATNAADEQALNGRAAAEAPVPGSRVVVSPDTVPRFATVNVEAFCENDEVEGVFSEAFPGGVGGRQVGPGHFQGTAVADPAQPGTFDVEADCKNTGMVSTKLRVLGDG
ncbi:hypothetical protein A8924_5183 [Saccharopolyspora erythraea NRRL 2338]|uniref:Uncharacterized protein n=2 Tax=Saccharopolyspora erythraea TaxID=1836 RepID=A4FJ40_SACEN|nr:hypothetical protein [Saccharopolyspora erythraea]EQD84679.1 hypothetical protein N599_18845 [Saccharopolyspora erythraea D]PFG97736.1 hypothetical protein A8924_5183 [Saccharopolyspora erythraea NRRL 2338]QRK87883.1 hypothetical protein JQX30_24390 [Saccharopolyspora erythraea]CAM04065.1 hypothetical protein SACE_4800 [Saccharopolyspora erythraea NRRL 2338]